MDLGIEGKVALVLSAGGGLGRMIAVALAKEGASLAVADRNEDSLAKTVAQIEATGVRAVSRSLDLMDIEALSSFVTRINGELGGVDILVAQNSPARRDTRGPRRQDGRGDR